MKLWAYATSPHGLGLEPERFWSMTPREFAALKRIHRNELMRWAIDRTMYANVHFLERDSEQRPIGEPWTPEDFLGETDRQKRNDEKQLGIIAAAQANAELMKMKAGDPPPEDLPAWATGIYG